MEKTKRSKLALISMILGALYLIYIIYYFTSNMASTTGGADTVGVGIATMLVLPHILCTGIALLFNILGYFMNKAGFMLTSGILYAVAMVLFLIYFMFVIIQMILSFVAYAKMKKEK
ncbi:hypothetical protein [Peptostreptococcus sp. D1]|uniref:hypothetical protein n=1 Tax=Peptostreptococcus sp. D1 TaxID=72304 RepID=UPI0008F28524|nr:hypothetical protein [Peptostreptococcus sp. D1]SFE88670.1 hypothetical protein SAMN02910278_01973 [Peptostreptococcus sp. D1]